MICVRFLLESFLNPLNAELNPICHLLALLVAHHILHVSRIRVNMTLDRFYSLGWFMPRHHTWEDTRKYIFFSLGPELS